MDPKEKEIKRLLFDAETSISKVAREIGVHKSTLSRAIRGDRVHAPTRAAFEEYMEKRLGRPVAISWPKAA